MNAPTKPAALVTGASRGIGAAVARALAVDGYPVFVHYRTQREKAEALCAAIASAGGRASCGAADLSDPAAPAGLVRAAREALGPVGILVNNAGGPVLPRPLAAASWDALQQMMDLQVRAPFLLAQGVREDMAKARWGRIVQIGTAYLWDGPPPGMGAYVAAKQALLGLTRALAAEWGPDGITVNCVSPSLVPTDLTAHLPQVLKNALAQQTPLRRLASPEDVAGAVRALCSPAGDFITGAHLPVTGGWRMP